MLSSTDTKCLWSIYKQPVMELYEVVPLRTFCCIEVDGLPLLPADVLLELRQNFIKCDSETTLDKHRWIYYKLFLQVVKKIIFTKLFYVFF